MTRSSNAASGQDARILGCLEDCRRPLSAYQIRRSLDGRAGPPAPIVIYRALRRLMDRGLVHRVASLRAFVACRDPEHAHRAVLSVCMACRSVEEAPVGAREIGFASNSPFTRGGTLEQVEIQIRCPTCRGRP